MCNDVSGADYSNCDVPSGRIILERWKMNYEVIIWNLRFCGFPSGSTAIAFAELAARYVEGGKAVTVKVSVKGEEE